METSYHPARSRLGLIHGNAGNKGSTLSEWRGSDSMKLDSSGRAARFLFYALATPCYSGPVSTSTLHTTEFYVASADVRLVVAMPALNEAATIERVIRGVPDRIPGVAAIEVVVVDDGSTDDTAALAETAGARVLRHHHTRGVGAAFSTALAYAIDQRAELLATIDSDGQFDPADLSRLVEPVAANRTDFATASRFIDPALVPRMPWIKRWGNRQMSRLISGLVHQRFYDVSCGMRCYNRRAMLNLNLLGDFTYTQEVFLNLAFKRLRILEVPLQVRGVREFGESRVASNLWRYAWNSARIILVAYRDYRPMRFFGAIAAALVVPAVLLGLFLLAHYLQTGGFSPHKWAGFVALALLLLGLASLHMGMIGDMLNRHRAYLEELLLHSKRHGTLRETGANSATASDVHGGSEPAG